MNGIVRLKHIKDYQKVSYYSVVLDQDDEPIESTRSLFEEFVEQQTGTNPEKLNHILMWLKVIGEKHGAQEDLFRHEQYQGEAVGVPPEGVNREPVFTENDEAVPNNLRLYCHRLNSDVVILLGGGLKTSDKAQNCPNVKSHFILANQLTKIIDKAFQENEIHWIDNDTDIDYDNDLILYY